MAISSDAGRGFHTLAFIPCAVIRFAVFAPFGYYWAYGTNHHNVIKDHEVLHNGTYDPRFVLGETIASTWGTFALYWNFAVWVPTLWFVPPLNLPFVIVDTVIVYYICKSLSYQVHYAPKSKSACDPAHNGNFSSIQHPAGSNESFYQAAARLNATATTPQKMCNDFREEYQYGIALAVLYGIIVLFEMIAFFVVTGHAKASGQSLRATSLGLAKGIGKSVIAFPKIIVVLLTAILWLLPQIAFRCLPNWLKAPVRIGRRGALKTALGAEQTTELKATFIIDEIKSRKAMRMRYHGGQGERSPLAEFLSIYDMLMIVTQHLHYLDIVHLSQVSKGVREAVLPTDDVNRRMRVFRLYTCETLTKQRCWACANQICNVCSQLPRIPHTTLLHHQDSCVPYCYPCYNTHIQRPRLHLNRSERFNDPYCKCAPVYAKLPNWVEWCLNGRKYYASRQSLLPKIARTVCGDCNQLDNDQLLILKEKKVRLELKQGCKSTGEKWRMCVRDGCARDLGTGPRWWVCSKTTNCLKECNSLVHAGWGRAMRAGEDQERSKRGWFGNDAA